MKKLNSDYGLISHVYPDSKYNLIRDRFKYPDTLKNITNFLTDNNISFTMYSAQDITPSLIEEMHGKVGFIVSNYIEVDDKEELVPKSTFLINIADHYVTRDSLTKTTTDILSNSNTVSFQFCDFGVEITNYNEVFGSFDISLRAQHLLPNIVNRFASISDIELYNTKIKALSTLSSKSGLLRDIPEIIAADELGYNSDNNTYTKDASLIGSISTEIQNDFEITQELFKEIKEYIGEMSSVRDLRISNTRLFKDKYDGEEYEITKVLDKLAFSDEASLFIVIDVQAISVEQIKLKQINVDYGKSKYTLDNIFNLSDNYVSFDVEDLS